MPDKSGNRTCARPGERLESFVGPPLFRPNFRSDYGIEVLNLEVDPR
jgi:hypothetical protein